MRVASRQHPARTHIHTEAACETAVVQLIGALYSTNSGDARSVGTSIQLPLRMCGKAVAPVCIRCTGRILRHAYWRRVLASRSAYLLHVLVPCISRIGVAKRVFSPRIYGTHLRRVFATYICGVYLPRARASHVSKGVRDTSQRS